MYPWFFIHIKLFARYCCRLARKDVITSIFFVTFLVYAAYSFVHTRSLLNIALLNGIVFSLLFSIDKRRKDKEFLRAVANNPARIYLAEYLSISLLVVIISINSLAHSLYLLALFFWLPLCIFLAKRQKARTIYFPVSKTISRTQDALIRSIPKRCFEWKSGMRRYKLLLWIAIGLIIQWFGYSVPEISLLSFGIVTFLIVSFYDICEQSVFIEIFADTPGVFIGRKIYLALVLASASFAPLALNFMLLHFQKFTLLAFVLLISYSTVITAVVTKYAYYGVKQNMEIIIGVTSAVVFALCLSATIQPIMIGIVALAIAHLVKLAQKNLARYFQPI